METRPVRCKTLLIVLFLMSLWPPWAFAQRQSLKNYGQEQGLSNLATECLLQDRAGYLWVGTQHGLFRYDGAEFTFFGEAEGLPSSAIESLAETSDGTLWVGTQRGPAWRQGKRFQAAGIGSHGQGQGHFELASDSSGRLFLTTAGGLMASTPPAAGSERRFEAVRGQPVGPAYGVYVEPGGVVWYGCGFSVCRLEAGTSVVFGPREGVPLDRWDAILRDRDGTVWLRSSKRLLRKAQSSGRFVPTEQPVPNISEFGALTAGRDGELFVPTDDGVWELSNGFWRRFSQAQGLISSTVSSVLQDREGSIWIGFWGAGLARWVGRNQWEGWTRAEGLSGEQIWMMGRDRRGDLWVATNNGLDRLHVDPHTNRPDWKIFSEKHGLAGDKTRGLAVAADGAIWTGGSPGGISRIDPLSENITTYSLPRALGSDRIFHISFDQAGTLWVSTRGGLYFANPRGAAATFERQELPMGAASEMVFDTLADRGGRLWVAGTRGLACRENGQWKRFTKRDGLVTDSAGFLAEAPDGSIWLAHRDRTGLSRVDVREGRLSVKRYTQGSGLASDQAMFVHVDRRGWVWYGSDRGVDVLRDGTWRHYGQEDGLIWDDCNGESFLDDADGSVWIGTSRGLAHFRPPATQPVLKGPRVEFTYFQLGDHVLDPSGPIVEPYRNRALVAHLSVLTFLAEGEVLCRYRVAGLDQNWLETRQREVRFQSLPPGEYALEAMARNAAGQWSPTPARVRFEILPPWWATNWFRIGVLLCVALCVVQLINWRTRRLVEGKARLEAAVEDRTRELRIEHERIERQNTEIERLLDHARQVNRMKDEFLANMSHEIRTPMNGIIGMVNVTLASELNTEQRESLDSVNTCAHALLGILNDILDFSKIEAGKMEIVPVLFRVEDTLQGACATFLATAREKGIGLAWDIDEAVPEWLECDAGRIRQVLLNLVGNALKFTHEGEVRIKVTARDSSDHTVELHFAVSDTGIGIPEQSHALIFEAFRQADGSTSRTYGGTGLGLTISSRLVQMMGGELAMESKPGEGSVFRFWVKAQRVEVPPECAKPARDIRELTAATRGLRILLAEDNVINQKVATALLSRRGHSVTVVGNGRLAVERYEAETFDLILMDLQMPELDGWDATRQIRERGRESGRHIPIIALTAHAMSHVQAQCLASGMDAMIVKPFDPAQFYETIERIVRPEDDQPLPDRPGDSNRAPGTEVPDCRA